MKFHFNFSEQRHVRLIRIVVTFDAFDAFLRAGEGEGGGAEARGRVVLIELLLARQARDPLF
jgi:hypothetical protein